MPLLSLSCTSECDLGSGHYQLRFNSLSVARCYGGGGSDCHFSDIRSTNRRDRLRVYSEPSHSSKSCFHIDIHANCNRHCSGRVRCHCDYYRHIYRRRCQDDYVHIERCRLLRLQSECCTHHSEPSPGYDKQCLHGIRPTCRHRRGCSDRYTIDIRSSDRCDCFRVHSEPCHSCQSSCYIHIHSNRGSHRPSCLRRYCDDYWNINWWCD